MAGDGTYMNAMMPSSAICLKELKEGPNVQYRLGKE